MANIRKSLTKKLRFEIFKRDSFTCQYCGRSAPDVVLEVDHINPVKRGGKNDILNLITSCFDCNRGKGKTKLDDNEVLKKQTDQLQELNLKREQLKLMMKWKKELNNIADEEISYINEYLEDYGTSLSEYGVKHFKKLIKSSGYKLVYECLEISFDKYYNESNPNPSKLCLDSVDKILRCKKMDTRDPMASKRYYIMGILRNRLPRFDKQRLMIILTKHLIDYGDYLTFSNIAKDCTSWDDFLDRYEESYYD